MKLFGRFRARREIFVREHSDARCHTRVVKFGCFSASLAGLPCLAQSPSFGLRCNHGGDHSHCQHCAHDAQRCTGGDVYPPLAQHLHADKHQHQRQPRAQIAEVWEHACQQEIKGAQAKDGEDI